MKKVVLISGMVFSCSTWTTFAHAQTDAPKSPVSHIPLTSIWAFQMPGTRDVRELEPNNFGAKVAKLASSEQVTRYKESLTFQIVDQLGKINPNQQALPGFVVSGVGREALQAAHAVLVEGQRAKQAFPIKSRVSLVFFSKALEYSVNLDKIERHGQEITVSYLLVPHRETVMSSHFALIPLDILPAGEFKVDFVRSRLPNTGDVAGFPDLDASLDSKIICRPFSFTIEGGKK